MAMDLFKKVQALSPESGARLSAAIDAMEETVSQGNKADFVLAESASDAAGRLLRDAEKSAAKKQEKSEGRGRRKRSPADSFYGNAFVGGDVEFKTEYQVDSRYREEVLNDALENSDSTEEKQLLEHYLRQILR